jgi:lysophospholipase L1-like esterase
MRSFLLSLAVVFSMLGCGSDGDPSPETGVRYVGRFDDTDPSAVRFSWSGSGFVVRFRGTGARATLRGGRFFTVVVDGDVQPDPLAVSGSDVTYDLASDLPNAEHTIEVYRRNEGSFGPTVVGGVAVDGEPLAVPRPTRQMEIVGDSWSTGDGVDAPSQSCDFSTQNHYLTWGAVAARAVDAELSTVALGGKGVVRSEDDSVDPLPVFYDRVIATEAGSTGTIRPADAVFVSAGANDLIEGELPDEFVAAYASLLEQIRVQHPDAVIACIWPKLPDAAETARVRAAIDAAIDARLAAGDTRVTEADIELDQLIDLACDNVHPGVETHALMAENTIAFLMAELGWSK